VGLWQLLFSFGGRIQRLYWWAASLVVAVAANRFGPDPLGTVTKDAAL
jgi:uncharacterized membrane protein YhaH (DUF805 family)